MMCAGMIALTTLKNLVKAARQRKFINYAHKVVQEQDRLRTQDQKRASEKEAYRFHIQKAVQEKGTFSSQLQKLMVRTKAEGWNVFSRDK